MARESGDLSTSLSFKASPPSSPLGDIHSGDQLATVTYDSHGSAHKETRLSHSPKGFLRNCVSVVIKCHHNIVLREAAWRKEVASCWSLRP